MNQREFDKRVGEVVAGAKIPATPSVLRELAAQWRGVAHNANELRRVLVDAGIAGAILTEANYSHARAQHVADMLDERAKHLEETRPARGR